MCGNDISTVVVPDESFIQQLRQQIAGGKVIVKNTHQGPKQNIGMNEIQMFKRFDTTRLNQIQLVKCDITYEMIEQFLKCDFSNLKILSLNNNKIGTIGCRVIAECETLTNLKTLQLSNNKIKDAGVKAIVTGKFNHLQDINLNDNNLTVDGVKALKTFPSIQYVSLAGNNLNDQSVQPIKQINKKGLSFLGLSRNSFSVEGLKKFLPINHLEVLLFDRNKITTPKKDLPVPKTVFLFY